MNNINSLDNNLLYIILEFLDEYNVNIIYNIKSYNTTIYNLILIEYINKQIKEDFLKQGWINKYTFDVIKELSSY
jgi:hypothetical protein